MVTMETGMVDQQNSAIIENITNEMYPNRNGNLKNFTLVALKTSATL